MILSMMVLRMVSVMAMVSVSVSVMGFDMDFRNCIPMLDSRSIGDSI